MKRVLLDQGLSPAAAALLRKRGWDALHVSELRMAAASDEEIINWAEADRRVCVTLDHDFHAHLASTSAARPSVVLLRIDGLKARETAELLVSIWDRFEEELGSGVAVSATPGTVRLRRLPLQRTNPE